MQNELIKIGNLLTQSNRQPLEIVSKMDNTELMIYNSFNSTGINRCSMIEVKETLKYCLQLSGSQTPTLDDFNFIVDFVIENYGNYKIDELKTAFKLLATDKLNVEKHIIFNPRLIGEVMSAYKRLAVQVRQKSVPKEKEEPVVQKIDEQQVVNDEVEWWNKTQNKDWRLLNYQVFDILWRSKKITLDKEKAEAIKSKVKAFYKTRVKNDKDAELIEEDTFIKQNCKKYTLGLYLNNEL
jgi:hypothetical protein